MANTETFVDEVNEELRKERLYGYFRRYGWIALLVVLALVGGAAYTEWTKASAMRKAEAFGGSVFAALGAPTPEGRATALAEIEPQAEGHALILSLIIAAQETVEAEPADAAATWAALAENAAITGVYRDLVIMKSQLAGGTDDTAEDLATLDGLIVADSPFAALAMEQKALLQIASGDQEAGLATLAELLERPGITDLTRRRVGQLQVALGVTSAAG